MIHDIRAAYLTPNNQFNTMTEKEVNIADFIAFGIYGDELNKYTEDLSAASKLVNKERDGFMARSKAAQEKITGAISSPKPKL